MIPDLMSNGTDPTTTPATNEAMEAFQKVFQEKAEYYHRSRSWLFRNVRRYKWLLSFLGLCSTIVLGLDLGEDNSILQKNIGLVIGAFITLFSIMLAYWNLEEYWMQTAVLTEQLAAFKARYEMKKSLGLTAAALQALMAELETILAQRQNYWKGAQEGGRDSKGTG